MKKSTIAIIIILVLLMFFLVLNAQEKRIIDRDQKRQSFQKHSQDSLGTVIATGSADSTQVGVDMLNQGGSAVDAALASALHYITKDMGRIVSFAGIFLMVYYEAETGKVYSLNACFKSPWEENDPLTIPSSGIPNARAVLVPGFMAGVQAAHDRFGRLPFTEVFAPAINLAENGFVLEPWQIWVIRDAWNILGIVPETRNVFLKRRYGLFRGYQVGDLFIQPELAHTLRQVASMGADYMFTGAWGQNFVNIVRREGGNITLRDMEDYEVYWDEPTHTTYNGYDIHALGYPSLGAMMVVLGINLMECANLPSYDHCSSSAQALYRLMYCSRVGEFFYPPYTPEILEIEFPEGDFSYASLAKKETAQLLWSKVETGEWAAIEGHIAHRGYRGPNHSEAIIAVDAEGNVAAICHTINANHWGNSGIFVDGVSIPGAGYFQQEVMNKIGPGAYVPDTTNPVLVLQNGVPVIASSCIGSDLHSSTVQNLYNMLNFDMSASESRNTPKFQSVAWDTLGQKVQNGVFSQSLLDAVQAMGLSISYVDQRPSEYWIGLRLRH